MLRKVNAIWNGDGAKGNGSLTVQSGAFNKMPYKESKKYVTKQICL